MSVFATALLSVLVPCAQDAQETVAVGEVGKRIVAWARAAESVGFSGAVLAARDGEVVAAVGVGSEDLRGKDPITPATLFEIASASKQVTAAAVMRLVEEGQVDLDASIGEYLPGVPEECQGITVRHLLQHTSGIPGTNSQGGGTKLKSVLPKFLDGGPRHEPGTHFEYWNQGYALLSEIIARASGADYVDYCREALFAPAGMEATCFTGDKAPKNASVAVGRSSRGKPRSALEHPYGSYGFQYRGMGGVVTNVWDLWRWDRALHGEEVLGEDARAQLFAPGLKDYALGWYVRTTKTGRRVQSHGGSVRGFVCDIRRYPEEDGCLFVLCNRDDFRSYRVAQGLEELLFEDKPTLLPPPTPLDEELAEALVGTYQDTRKNELVIEREGMVTRANIHWAAGPVTNAHLGLAEDGDLVLYEWTAANPVELERKGKKPVKSLELRNWTYKRMR